jgi:hypothetical protein
MKRMIVVALACLGSLGCPKGSAPPDKSGQYSGGGNPTVGGAVQAVRGAATRIVTAAELHDLHLFMTNARAALGRVPTSHETLAELSRPDGNRKLVSMINDGTIVLVPNPAEEGLWAYSKDARTAGGWILTHAQPEQVTAQEFVSRYGMNDN